MNNVLRCLKNKVFGRIFGPKNYATAVELRRLHNAELRELDPIIIIAAKTWAFKIAGFSNERTPKRVIFVAQTGKLQGFD